MSAVGLCVRCGGLTSKHYVTTTAFVWNAFCGPTCARAYRHES